MKTSRFFFQPATPRSGFTMIEIALCLGIIGFGLVAIIAALPTGLNVQKDNREETIINQDATLWMDAIRSGARGYDDLTNYVTSISIYWARFDSNNVAGLAGLDYYTQTNCSVTSTSGVPASFALTGGGIIVGLLSTPKYTPPMAISSGAGYQSNYVVAYVRAMSGPVVDKMPQRDTGILDNAFSYRMVTELAPYVPFDPRGTNFNFTPTNAATLRRRIVTVLEQNSTDLRLFFRWPVLPTGEAGNSRQTFRLFAGGVQITFLTNSWPPLYFLQPSLYAQTP